MRRVNAEVRAVLPLDFSSRACASAVGKISAIELVSELAFRAKPEFEAIVTITNSIWGRSIWCNPMVWPW
jgi:hypothetical protein